MQMSPSGSLEVDRPKVLAPFCLYQARMVPGATHTALSWGDKVLGHGCLPQGMLEPPSPRSTIWRDS